MVKKKTIEEIIQFSILGFEPNDSLFYKSTFSYFLFLLFLNLKIFLTFKVKNIFCSFTKISETHPQSA